MSLYVEDVMPPDVRAAWKLKSNDVALKLVGGSDRSIRVGSVVFKSADDIVEAQWCQECLSQIVPQKFRVADPVRSPQGHWVEAGWMASRWVEGVKGPVGHWDQILEVSWRFHQALSMVDRPPFLVQRSHRWAIADRAAFGELPISWLAATLPRVQALKKLWEPMNLPNQIIHGDLSGNVLFSSTLSPAVIDFSPYWRPAGYADAIILMDGLLWFTWDDILPLIPRTAIFSQLLVRAALFRLGALNERARTIDPACLDDLARFDRTIQWLATHMRP